MMASDISQQPEQIWAHLRRAKTIAVVGLSHLPSKASYEVALDLQMRGYRIIPVNPTLIEPVLNERPYARLSDIPLDIRIDIINVFRRPADIPPIADQAMLRPAPLFWMQLGISHHEAARRLVAAGMDVVQDRCIKIELARMR